MNEWKKNAEQKSLPILITEEEEERKNERERKKKKWNILFGKQGPIHDKLVLPFFHRKLFVQ